MKLCTIAVFVSTLLFLHTVTAIPGLGLRYIRSSFDNVNSRYRSRDIRPTADSEDVKASPPADTGNADIAPQPADKVKPQQQELARLGKPASGNPLAAEEMLTDKNNGMPEDAHNFVDEPASVETVPQTLPADMDYPKRRGDSSAFVDSADQDSQSSISQSVLSKLKMYAASNTVLANIARIPRTVATQIDSVIAGLQTTYPTNTNVGAYMVGTRFLLNNPRALKPFDLLDQAGFGRLPDLVSSMPSIFIPVINAMDRIWEAIVRRSAAVFQRFAGAVRRVSERASRSLTGVSVSRGMDSYAISVPNVVDMVLKGQLANRVDELFAYLQRLIGSGLSSIGSVFRGGNIASDAVSADNPISASEPTRNKPTYRMRSPSRFSTPRDYYRPTRYYDN